MRTVIILDRSGSMCARWVETLGALDNYVGKLKEKDRLSMLAFDDDFEWVAQHRRMASLTGDKPLKEPMQKRGIAPRGMTALYDAIRMADEFMSDIKKGKKVEILILTDGLENASRKTNLAGVKAIIEKWKANNWDLTMIGADFDALPQATAMGISAGQTMSYDTKHGDLSAAMEVKREAYRNYHHSVNFSDEDRKKASGQAN